MLNDNKSLSKTPLYEALHSDRYARQKTICSIQEQTNRKLIVYEASLWSYASFLSHDDVQPFGDLLDPIPQGASVDLLIHSPGGDVEAAEKIVYMCRHRAASLRVIIPEYAKSAATLIALASDEIIMGIASELGPIDAQLPTKGPGDVYVFVSAQSFIDEFDSIKQEVTTTGSLSPAYFPLLEGVTLGFIGLCRNSMKRSEKFAEKWLAKYMLADAKDPTSLANSIAKDLCDVKKWHTHGAVIDADEAKQLGIKVQYIEPEAPLWRDIWYLHCCYGVLLRQQAISKVFESETVSLPFK